MLHLRWLGRVSYDEALALQRQLFERRVDGHLLLLEHDPVFTIGRSGDPSHLLVDPDAVGAAFREADRGGDITYHGPGQLTGYPIIDVPGRRGGGMADTAAYVASVEQLLIDALRDVGLPDTGRLAGYPGVWVDRDLSPRKIAAVGVRLSRGRSMHGFALNVTTDLARFDQIVPCGIREHGVTSLAAEGVDATMRDVVDAVFERASEIWGGDGVTRSEVTWRRRRADLSAFSRGEGPGAPSEIDLGGESGTPAALPTPVSISSKPRETSTTARRRRRLDAAGVGEGLEVGERKPEWMRIKLRITPEYTTLKRTMRELDLVTVCEEAGCPNIFECWADGTATFMINGERCTRACGFCLVDTRKPEALDAGEPARVAEAVERMGLAHAVVTAVARDDLDDGGAAAFAATIQAIRARTSAAVEVLIPDFGGDPDDLQVVLDARPDVLNHNVETVARLQYAVRPSAGYARSLAVLARARAAGLTTKTSIIVGMGERDDEVAHTLADLAGIGCDIVTIGQYLRPTSNHIPIDRWVPPSTFDEWTALGQGLGIAHVEAGPLTRSSYHARQSARSALETSTS